MGYLLNNNKYLKKKKDEVDYPTQTRARQAT